jgi:DNA-binding NtrC family response regulator
MFSYLRSWLLKRRVRAVLVVEDDALMRPVFRRVLRAVDPQIEMHWAGSVAQACRALSERSFCLVISDYMLPNGGSGVSLWRLCRQFYPEMPFLMVSGLSRKTIENIHGPNEVPSHLRKPFLTQECLERIRTELNERRA